MICGEVVPRLGEFLVGALESAEDAAVQGHVEQCESCASELGAVGSIARRL